ncbi:hypothetical protein SPSIL_056020 [Sporomusa silvacetica DSM 10669]|uniref:NHLP leader peptide family natural product n=1 Tax=Sporomusa silvacetica DSM 10669 TaxID=1123289 RepID=A0ABZ3IUH2_9FIRM|nr:NHLP leader peptide family RiPP precursor [Sporomusa silvacetica]OZC13013.1 hypothetical protein SPSIL_57330 [Sporomusa silvacetica DSM 10669]
MSENKLLAWQEFPNGLIAKAMKDESFRKELLANPKAVMEKEMDKLKKGAKFPAALEVKVIEQPANVFYLVLPTATGQTSDEELDMVSGGQDVVLNGEGFVNHLVN